MRILDILGSIFGLCGGIVLISHFSGLYTFGMAKEDIVFSILLLYIVAYIFKEFAHLLREE